MYALITVILVLISIFLVLIILVQNPKGGGLGAGFGGGSAQAFGGVQRTTDFLEKATWSLVIAFLVLSLLSNVFINDPSNANVNTDAIQQVQQDAE